MSTPVAIAAIIGAFVLGLVLGVPVGLAVLKRRAREAIANAAPLPIEVPQVPAAEPTLKLPTMPSVVASGAAASVAAAVQRVVPKAPTHVITNAGDVDDSVPEGERKEFKVNRPQLEQIAKVAMVEAASLAHGVRSALSEENRAKIQYEIKRELIALRKTRKAEVKQALAEYRAKHRALPDDGDGS
jgi:hypothetical protein